MEKPDPNCPACAKAMTLVRRSPATLEFDAQGMFNCAPCGVTAMQNIGPDNNAPLKLL